MANRGWKQKNRVLQNWRSIKMLFSTDTSDFWKLWLSLFSVLDWLFFIVWITTSMQRRIEKITQWFYWGVQEVHVPIGLKVRPVCWLIKHGIQLSLNQLVVPLEAWAISISGCRYLCCWFTFYVKSLLNFLWRCFI